MLLATQPVCGQIAGGSIVGIVTDQSRGAVIGAKVKALNQQTNEQQEVTTNETGYYEFPLLRPGRYRLAVEAVGFERILSAEFDVATGTRPRIDLQLKVGSFQQTVEVKDTAPLINTTTTDLGTVVDRARIEELPLNGRNFQQLLALEAGVESSPGNAAGNRGGVSFHGSSAFGTNMLLDGVDMSFGDMNGTASFAPAGGPSPLINTVSVKALEEFRATGGAFSAEYGRTGGGVVNVTTRSGTNRFHGTLFEFFRNDKIDANDFFSNKNNLGKPPLRWNQFGGNLGGPIRKDRLFFFFNYEGARVKRLSQIKAYVPTPALLAAVPSAMRPVLQLWALPNYTPSTSPYLGYHVRNDSSRDNENTYLTRVDAALGKHREAIRYSQNDQDYSAPATPPTMPLVYPMRFHNVAVQDNWTVNATSFNEVRVGVNRVNLNRHNLNTDQIPAYISAPSLGASFNNYIWYVNTTYTLADNYTLVRGAHSIKAGFEIREQRSTRYQGGPPGYTYNSIVDLIADKPISVAVYFGRGRYLRTRNHGFYAQDEWRLKRSLQVNLGVRYEYSPPFRGGFNMNSSDPYGPFIQKGDPMWRADRNDWAPRVGLAWVPDRAQRMAVRAGAGVSYMMPVPTQGYYAMGFESPLMPSNASFTAADAPAEYLVYPRMAGFAGQVTANPSLLPKSLLLSRVVADYNQRDAYVGTWNFSIERRMAANFVVQGSYVGSRTVKEASQRQLNLIDPATGTRPRPQLGYINFIENAARISYNALEMSLKQRGWHGLRLDANFTWAKDIGYYNPDSFVGAGNAPGLQDPNNIAGSKGPLAVPGLRYRSVLSYAIPGGAHLGNRVARAVFSGWTLHHVANWRKALPLDVVTGTDIIGVGAANSQRPDLVMGVNPYIRNVDVWLNPAAFTTVYTKAQKRYGNLGYNALRGPSALGMDAALHKTFPITERQRIAFRLETFSVLNHPDMGNPNVTLSNLNFGRITGASGNRNVQLALKYLF
jgi:hypothetical protein